MVTLLGNSFSTNENTVAQADVQLLGRTAESLIVEFDQEKFEKFISSGSASFKIMRQYRKISSGTCSRFSLEISPEVACTPAHNTSSSTSNEVLKTSCAAYAACVNVSQETHRANTSVQDQSNGEDKLCHYSPLRTLQFHVPEGFQQLLRLNWNAE